MERRGALFHSPIEIRPGFGFLAFDVAMVLGKSQRNEGISMGEKKTLNFGVKFIDQVIEGGQSLRAFPSETEPTYRKASAEAYFLSELSWKDKEKPETPEELVSSYHGFKTTVNQVINDHSVEDANLEQAREFFLRLFRNLPQQHRRRLL